MQVITEELSVLATSPDAARGNAALAARVAGDQHARALLMMRGALYAARESATIASRTKGARNLEGVLSSLLEQARVNHYATYAPLSVGAWLAALAQDDPEAAGTFDALVVRGAPITLPVGALGPCFRAGVGEYVAYDPGFDVDATRHARDKQVVGLRPDGPAAKAGLVEGDRIESIASGAANAASKMSLVVSRSGKPVTLSYLPRGAHGRGQTWSRVPGVPDDKCGLPP